MKRDKQKKVPYKPEIPQNSDLLELEDFIGLLKNAVVRRNSLSETDLSMICRRFNQTFHRSAESSKLTLCQTLVNLLKLLLAIERKKKKDINLAIKSSVTSNSFMNDFDMLSYKYVLQMF